MTGTDAHHTKHCTWAKHEEKVTARLSHYFASVASAHVRPRVCKACTTLGQALKWKRKLPSETQRQWLAACVRRCERCFYDSHGTIIPCLHNAKPSLSSHKNASSTGKYGTASRFNGFQFRTMLQQASSELERKTDRAKRKKLCAGCCELAGGAIIPCLHNVNHSLSSHKNASSTGKQCTASCLHNISFQENVSPGLARIGKRDGQSETRKNSAQHIANWQGAIIPCLHNVNHSLSSHKNASSTGKQCTASCLNNISFQENVSPGLARIGRRDGQSETRKNSAQHIANWQGEIIPCLHNAKHSLFIPQKCIQDWQALYVLFTPQRSKKMLDQALPELETTDRAMPKTALRRMLRTLLLRLIYM